MASPRGGSTTASGRFSTSGTCPCGLEHEADFVQFDPATNSGEERTMDTRHLVDREIASIIDLFPRVDLDSAPIAQIRAKAAETYAILPPPVIVPEEIFVPSIHGGPDIAVYLFRPELIRADAGAILPLQVRPSTRLNSSH